MRRERIPLSGSREERILQIFRLAGWYEGRSVDISMAEAHYREEKVPMTGAARAFFREYWGLPESWDIFLRSKMAPELGESCDSFDFTLYPDGIDSVGEIVYDPYPVKGRQQQLIDEAAGEMTTLVGEIGYYYPARLWVGDSGTLYALHYDYDPDKVCIFHSMVEFVDSELRMDEINAVLAFPEPSGRCVLSHEEAIRLRKPKMLFFQYAASHFQMLRDDAYREYEQYHISRAQEMIWIEEMLEDLKNQLDSAQDIRQKTDLLEQYVFVATNVNKSDELPYILSYLEKYRSSLDTYSAFRWIRMVLTFLPEEKDLKKRLAVTNQMLDHLKELLDAPICIHQIYLEDDLLRRYLSEEWLRTSIQRTINYYQAQQEQN